MSIKKILLLASMAMAAVAFAAPAVAQANISLTGADVGDPVTATGIDVTTTTSNGTLECEEVTLHYEVSIEGPDHVVLVPVPNQPAGTDKHNGTTKNCFLNTGAIKLPATIATAGTGNLTINTWGTAEADATFTSVIPAVGLTCEFKGKVPVQTTNTSHIAHIETGNTLTGTGSSNCPKSGEMHGTFTVESGLNQVSPHFVATP